MPPERSIHQVSITFAGAPPARRAACASGVGEVEIDGQVMHCLVSGSFQPLLEALHGYEVLALQSTPVNAPASASPHEGDH